jgi:hypothetical protein
MTIDAQVARSKESNRYCNDNQGHDVFVAFSWAKDEEAIFYVVGHERYHHDTDNPCSCERRQKSNGQKDATTNFGQAREPRVELSWAHAEAFKPPTGSGNLSATKNVIDAVR